MTHEPLTDAFDVGDCYRTSRIRLTALISEAGPGVGTVPVRACPGWDVSDVLAHLVGVIEDAAAGRLSGPPSIDMTAVQVRRHQGDSVDHLLEKWESMAAPFESAISSRRVVPAFLDVLSHEHDIRLAVGRPGGRDDADVLIAAHQVKTVADVPVRIELDDSVTIPSADPGGVVVLRAPPFEVFRFRLGHRTREEVRALEWSSDPIAFLDRLFVFGPALESIGE